MQKISPTPALLAVLLATAVAACAPASGPVAAETPQASFAAPTPQPRLGFTDFSPPNI